MKRIIKFRGKTRTTHEWVYGYYVKRIDYDYGMIYADNGVGHKVDPETVGQFINNHDRNNQEIYEDDIVVWESNNEETCSKTVVQWTDDITGFLPFNSYDCDNFCYGKNHKVIGNIYENPELLK